MARVFICYRRADTSGDARSLFTSLTGAGFDVFMDIDRIELGRDFVEAIREVLSTTSIVLVLIGSHWLTDVDERGQPRLLGSNDYVRQEITRALRQRAIRTIPILLHGARVPDEDELPKEIKSLARRHAIELRHTRWDDDVADLVRRLQSLVSALSATGAGGVGGARSPAANENLDSATAVVPSVAVTPPQAPESDDDEIVSAAQRRAEEIISQAESRAQAIVRDAKAQADMTNAELDERRRTAEAEQMAIEERVATLQASIGTAEDELRLARAKAEREAREIFDDARQRADSIVADAEQRLNEAEAQSTAIQQRVEEIQATIRNAEEELRQNREVAEHEAQKTVAAARRRADEIIAEALTRAGMAATVAPFGATPKTQQVAAAKGSEDTAPTVRTGLEPARRTPEPPRIPAPNRADQSQPAASVAAPVPRPAAAKPTGVVTQTLIFRAVPNIPAVLALERSIKEIAKVHDVRVVNFDEGELLLRVTHELGSELPRVLLAQRAAELELIEALLDRVEFIFRS